MTSIDAALQALRTEVKFGIAEIAAAVAGAASLAAQVERDVAALSSLCDAAGSELRDAMARTSIDPVIVNALHRLYQIDHHRLRYAQDRLAVAQEQERQARSVFAELRNRERSLDRALKAERGRQRLKQQARYAEQVDEMWLQRAWSGRP